MSLIILLISDPIDTLSNSVFMKYTPDTISAAIFPAPADTLTLN